MTDDSSLFTGSNDRAVARALQLVSLLLQGPRQRQQLGALLGEALAAEGWQGALKGDADGLRNLDRDLGTLRDLGLLEIPRGKSYQARPGDRLPLWATPAEAQALAIAAMGLQQLGLPEAATLEALARRIPLGIREAGEQRAVSLSPSLRVSDEGIWAALQRGVADGRCLRLLYQKPNDQPPETLVLDRAQIVWLTGAYYLVAFRPHYAQEQPGLPAWKYVREYRLDRIREVVVLETPVSLATLPVVRCQALLDQELRERVFPLRAPDGRYLQEVEPLSNGTVRLTFEDVSLLRARQRLLSFGEHLLAVESPEDLRVAIERSVRVLATAFN